MSLCYFCLMEKIPLLNLELCAPLVYSKLAEPTAELFSVLTLAENEEFLLCFELEPAQSQSIEPEPQLLIGAPVFAGRKTNGQNLQDGGSETITLPAGKYLFVQRRANSTTPQLPVSEPADENSQNKTQSSPLDMKEWLDLAVEQQKDALWERHKPANILYVRFLFEDGGQVTQVIRPCE